MKARTVRDTIKVPAMSKKFSQQDADRMLIGATDSPKHLSGIHSFSSFMSHRSMVCVFKQATADLARDRN